jgi:hypothetical protein
MRKGGIIAIASAALLTACAVDDALNRFVDGSPRTLGWIYAGHPEKDWGDLSNAHFCRVNHEPPDSDHCMKAAGYVRGYR